MKITRTVLPEVLLIEPQVFRDPRGFFVETYSKSRYVEQGIKYEFVQDNLSHSQYGVLRGLHYQLSNPQGKLVRCVRGEVFDVAVDIRVGSPNFGKASHAILSEENQHQLYIPPGFAHGFCVMSSTADFEYKCTDFYHPEDEGCIKWDDHELKIPWPVELPTVSDKDHVAQHLRAIPQDLLPRYKK